MLNSVKFILLAQSYIGAFFVMSWWHDDLQFAPWWLKTPVFIVVCVFLVAPVFWLHLENEEWKKSNRRSERLQYLEKKHYFSD